jgi:uncharacterized protein involved in type VI secretion and phage assembly
MALMKDLSRAQLAFQVQGYDVDEFLVVRFRGTEGLSQLYKFEVDLVLSRNNPSMHAVSKPAALSVNTAKGERWFHGVVGRFEITGEGPDQTYARATLVPSLWLLTHRYCSRIFQNKSVKDIITQVLTDGGIPADRYDLSKLAKAYPVREYTVQYRETDFNFISRLMEHEGIFYFFEQSKDKHVLVLVEKNGDCVPIPDDATLPYQPPTGLATDTEHVWRFRQAASIRPRAVILNDFNFENPALDLKAEADTGETELTFSDFPGEYQDQARGTELAALRADEFFTNLWTSVGMSNCPRLAPGRKFALSGHPWQDTNGDYLITSVTHEGKESTARSTTGTYGRSRALDARVHQSLLAARNNDNPAIADLAEGLLQIAARLGAGDPTANRALTHWLYHAGQVVRDLPSAAFASGANPLEWLAIPNLISDLAPGSAVDFDAPVYTCRFECRGWERQYRPPRITPWPVIGTQTARVVGPQGEEINVDKYGRVKVQFNWDLQGNEGGQPKRFGADSSCWIRVCQGMAGGAYGIMFIPRVGQEVVVDFLEGNPDKPIIIGRVYNADLMPPYELPKEKTKSVIKTHSSKGGEGCNEIRFEDLKDKEQLLLQAQRQMDTNVKGTHYHTVGGSYHLMVGYEKDGQQYGEYRQLVHKLKQTHVKEERRTWIEKDDGLEVDGARAESIGGTLSVTVGKDVVEDFKANHKHEVAATYTSKAANIQLSADGTIELKAGGSSIVLCAAGVYIQGSLVNINCGAGPSVAPISATAAGPAIVDDPGCAEGTQPGKNVTYTGPSATVTPITPQPEVPGHEFPEEPPPQPATHFIEIQLRDELGNPIVGEKYEITTPDGKLRTGTTDANGHARENNLVAGQCQIKFPRLDTEAWERDTGA